MHLDVSGCNIVTQVYLPVATGSSFLLGLFVATTVCLCCKCASRKPNTTAGMHEPDNLGTADPHTDTVFENPAAGVPTYYNAASCTYTAESVNVLTAQNKPGYENVPPLSKANSVSQRAPNVQQLHTSSSATECKAVSRNPGYINVILVQSPPSLTLPISRSIDTTQNADGQRMAMSQLESNAAYAARKKSLC